MLKKIGITILTILILTIGGCVFIITYKGSRMDAELHFSHLSKLYPTKNVEDIFEKYPEGGTLIHIRFVKEGDDKYKYYYRLKVDSKNKTIIGKEDKIIYKYNKYTDIYSVPVEYKNGEIIYLENPELENHKITFLFENLSYAEMIRYKFKRSSYGYDSDSYTLSYYIPIDLAQQYLDFDEKCEAFIYINAKTKGFADVRLDSIKCSESITETFKIGE